MKPNPGIDYIGGVNYIDVICQHHPEDWAAGFLCLADGWRNGLLAARALAETKKCPIMRIHGVWHDHHQFSVADLEPAMSQARRVATLKEDFPWLKIYYSPWLEPGNQDHPCPPELLKRCLMRCKAWLPQSIKLVAGRPLPRRINEIHHSFPILGKYIHSYDGDDCLTDKTFAATIAAHRKAILSMLWTPACNGKTSVLDHTPRPERKAYLTGIHIHKMRNLYYSEIV